MNGLNIQLSINQKIEIIEDNTTYKSNIQDINEDYIMIGMPISGSRYYMMHSGTIIEFYVCSDKEVIKCRSVVLGKQKEKNLQLAIISIPEVIEKVQRREFFRLPIVMELKYYALPEDSTYIDLKGVPSGYFKRLEKTLSIDISGGGMMVITKAHLQAGRHILISLMIPEEINLLCTVVRCEYNNIDKNYRTALRYEKIDERIRDKIIKFIFSKLREQSKLLK